MSSPGETDYVPGAVNETIDYTADDRAALDAGNPLGSTTRSVDDEEGFAGDFRPDVTLEEIEKGSFRFIGPGDHTVYIKDIEWVDSGNPVHEKMYVKQPDGSVRPMAMSCQKVKVIFAIRGDENCTASDMFLMPPSNPAQMDAYEYGYSDTQGKGQKLATDNPREKGGFHAKKLKYFLGRIFTFDSSGKIPESAKRFSNWKKYPGTNIHKQVGITVTKGKAGTYKDKKTGEEKESQGFNNIKLFTYRFIEPPAEVLIAQKQAELARTKALAASVAKPVEKPVEPAQEQSEASETQEEKPKKPSKKVVASV